MLIRGQLNMFLFYLSDLEGPNTKCSHIILSNERSLSYIPALSDFLHICFEQEKNTSNETDSS